MIRLTDLLNEIIMSGKSYQFAMERLFPLAGKIGDKIWEKQRIRGFHITHPDNIAGLKSMAGSRKALSISTRIPGYSVIQIDGPVSGGMMVWVEGDVLFKSYSDLGSKPDENGRRWINLRKLSTQLFDDYSNYLTNDREYQMAYDNALLATKTLQKWAAFTSPSEDPKEFARLRQNEKNAKALLIKAHMDSSWSWLTSGSNLVKMQMYVRDMGNQIFGNLGNNEYIVTNIKLIDALIFDMQRPSDWQQRPHFKEVDIYFEKVKKNIKSAISGELVIAQPEKTDPSAKIQKKFYSDRFSEDPNI